MLLKTKSKNKKTALICSRLLNGPKQLMTQIKNGPNAARTTPQPPIARSLARAWASLINRLFLANPSKQTSAFALSRISSHVSVSFIRRSRSPLIPRSRRLAEEEKEKLKPWEFWRPRKALSFHVACRLFASSSMKVRSLAFILTVSVQSMMSQSSILIINFGLMMNRVIEFALSVRSFTLHWWDYYCTVCLLKIFSSNNSAVGVDGRFRTRNLFWQTYLSLIVRDLVGLYWPSMDPTNCQLRTFIFSRRFLGAPFGLPWSCYTMWHVWFYAQCRGTSFNRLNPWRDLLPSVVAFSC